jgi:hypothetical protein
MNRRNKSAPAQLSDSGKFRWGCNAVNATLFSEGALKSLGFLGTE